MNKLECIISDMDGSLVGDNQTISPQDVDTIRTIKSKGIPFFFVTGRHQIMCRTHMEKVGFDYPLVCNNGSTIYDFASKKGKGDTCIPPDIVKRFWSYCKEHEYLCYVFTTQHAYVHPDYHKPDFPDKFIARIVQGTPSIVFDELTPDFDPVNMDVVKLLVPNIPPEELAKLKAIVDPEKFLEISYSSTNFADVTRSGVDKGKAVQQLAQLYGFSLENTLAMGDNYNDLKMLQLVGYPVATANAESLIREVSRYITADCNSSPLTRAVNHFFPELLRS